VEAVFAVLREHDIDAEMIIVDDNSPDGTGEVADQLAERFKVRVLHRPGKMGLASAVVDGFRLARGSILGVMDADLSHAPSAIPRLLKAIKSGEAELAVGSRYVADGGTKDWPLRRQLVSIAACWLARPLTGVRDATSGFLFMRRGVIEGVQLNPIGFKIGLEIIARGRYSRCVEVPYVFRDRFAGHSKFGKKEVIAYLRQLAQLAAERIRRKG
jgi:dolichol-phosphate mannosyltransferase